MQKPTANQNKELWVPVFTDITTKQVLHLSSGNTVREGWKDYKKQKDRESAVRLYLLVMPKATPPKISPMWLPKVPNSILICH